MADATSLGITPPSNPSLALGLVYNSVFPTISNAAQLGELSQNQTDISVMSQLDPNISSNYYTFYFTSGSSIKLAFNSTVGLAGDANGDPAGTQTDGVAAGLRYQLYDVTGNLVADSGGTAAQQQAYADLTSSTGLTASTGAYTVKVSSASGSPVTSQTAYNFQLYSGTTYATNLVYTAQTQSYDPNLFTTAASTITPSSNVTTYTNSATLSGTQSSAVGLGTLDANQSELYASSTVNSANQASYYSFDFNSGNAIKFNLLNTTDTATQQALRVQLYDNNGNLVADSNGTEAQQEAYKKLDSGEGLSAANGTYTAKVSYAPGTYTSSAQTYNFQLYSGASYQTTYNTSVALPSTTVNNNQFGQNVGVFADQNEQLYSRSEYHAIGETASTGPNIGWISANKSATNVVSQLSHVDSSEFYNFTLQQGNDLKMTFNNQTDTSNTRIQILDSTGNDVIADNYGTAAQKAAFAQLTSSTGLAAKAGTTYAVQVSYAPGADTTKSQTYDFQIYSGTSYTSLYKFTASAQTYQNAVLSGNTSVAGYNTITSSVGYLDGILNGTSSNSIFNDLIA